MSDISASPPCRSHTLVYSFAFFMC